MAEANIPAPDKIPAICLEKQLDAKGIQHFCTGLVDGHTRHTCSASCRYTWRSGKRGAKPKDKF